MRYKMNSLKVKTGCFNCSSFIIRRFPLNVYNMVPNSSGGSKAVRGLEKGNRWGCRVADDVIGVSKRSLSLTEEVEKLDFCLTFKVPKECPYLLEFLLLDEL
jgi:hypothetical protein